jgi:hypothetical protein
MDEKKNTKTQVLEKVQDVSRDVFVTMFILIVFVIPTIYIGVRAFQPMTLPNYTNTTFYGYLKDQFVNHVDENLATQTFLEVLVSPYAAAIKVVTQLYPNLDSRTKGQSPEITWRDVPNAWWTGIQKECIYWLDWVHSR